jgi:hypothetical protein
MQITDLELEILLPVHHEGDSIERVVREIYTEIAPKSDQKGY